MPSRSIVDLRWQASLFLKHMKNMLPKVETDIGESKNWPS